MAPFNTLWQQESHELLLTHPKAPSPGATGEENVGLKQSRLRKWWSGWKFTLFVASGACVLVLAFNLGFLFWALARDKLENGRGVLYEGECERASRLSTGLHLLINVFSTLLLGASNYGMQCLCAPTRRDVDRVHYQGGWLNIGVPSIRNLGHVSKRRTFMWLCLLLSSVPLHLLYNSTIFYTISAYGYDVFVGREPPNGKPLEDLDPDGEEIPFTRLYQKAHNGSLENLTATDCFNAYETTYQTKYGAVIIISDDMEEPTRYDWVGGEEVLSIGSVRPHAWMCDTCSASDAAQGNWEIAAGYLVKSCLSERVPQNCRLQYSLPLTIVVIVSNLVKAVVLGYMAIRNLEPPLLTTGDAIASFLHRPDPHSVGKCLLSAASVRSSAHRYESLVFQNHRRRWYSTVRAREWLLLISLWGITIGVCIFLIFYGQAFGGKEIWDAKFGASTSSVNASTLITGAFWPTNLIAVTIIANVPQLIFSLLYFTLNSILTSMTLAAEWSRYAVSRRGLRVSWNSRAAQRNSYFLSLPYRYAIPLLATSATLHWLISQSLFLVGVVAYDSEWERIPRLDLTTCGYTPVAIVSVISVGAAMLLCVVALGIQKLDSGVVAGSCSLAIAAACHPEYDPNSSLHDESQQGQIIRPRVEMEYLPVQWGAVLVDGAGDLGHCTFTSERVEMPVDGRYYQ